MSIINKAFTRKQITPTSGRWVGGVSSNQFEAKPVSLDMFLRAYCTIGWFHACVATIAKSVAEVEWILYEKSNDGTRKEVSKPHPLKDLLNSPNKFQTGHDLIEMTQIYQDCTGEGYWHYDKRQNTLWSLPPNLIGVVADAKEFIKGYTFGSESTTLTPIPVEEIIPFISPNPMNPIRGSGPAQAIAIELDTQSFALQHNRNFFYRGAYPGLVISYPDSIPIDEYERLITQWKTEHRGYGRAHETAIITGGGKVENISMTNRDIDFVKLMAGNRDSILGAYGVPYSILGGSEHVNKATAEAAQVDFGTRVIRPRLIKFREKLNKFLCPIFGKNLELDFTNPVPTDQLQEATITTQAFQAGYITINEARDRLGWPLFDAEMGDQLMWPAMFMPQPINEPNKLVNIAGNAPTTAIEAEKRWFDKKNKGVVK